LTFDWSTIDFLSYLEISVALSHISELHTLLRKLSHTHTLHELSLLLKNFYLQRNFCAYWLLTLSYILVYFWNAIWLFYQLFIHACSKANVREIFFFLHISLCFLASSVKHPDEHVLASGRPRLCRSLIWQHAVRTSMYHVRTQAFCFLCQTHTTTFFLFYRVVCVFSQTDPKILAFSTHLFSFPGISFDFPYSLMFWIFLEYWNL
jgi:hypothetical protein